MENTRKDETTILGNGCYVYVKEHSIHQDTLGRYVDKLHQDEYNEMKKIVWQVFPNRMLQKSCLKRNFFPVLWILFKRVYLRIIAFF